jgi:site-specific recombinase XerD
MNLKTLRGSGGNLKLAQELARHQDTSTTQLYAHLSNDELDQGYFEIFDQSEGESSRNLTEW